MGNKKAIHLWETVLTALIPKIKSDCTARFIHSRDLGGKPALEKDHQLG